MCSTRCSIIRATSYRSYELAQHIRIEMAVGVGDESPGQAEHARISGERAVGQLRQLAIVARRQGRADFADLPLDQIVVVHQPFGCRRDGTSLVDCAGDPSVCVQQDGAIVGEPAGQ